MHLRGLLSLLGQAGQVRHLHTRFVTAPETRPGSSILRLQAIVFVRSGASPTG